MKDNQHSSMLRKNYYPELEKNRNARLSFVVAFWIILASLHSDLAIVVSLTPLIQLQTKASLHTVDSKLNSLEAVSVSCESIRNKLDSYRHFSVGATIGLAFFVCGAAQVATASEIGVEVEAPTFVTGETVEICTKRGILGACLKTELRTDKNDNDVSRKYFRDPTDIIKQRDAIRNVDGDEGNALIQRLRQQSFDNAETNNLIVQRKTFENDQAATFGPFDRQVLIMNTDGKTFTLLQNPQAMRLKKAGFIGDRRQFIKQPTQEEIDKALESEGFFAGIFGSS